MRKTLLLNIIFLLLSGINISVFSATDKVSIDTISNYQGWGWDVLVIKNSYITLAVVPAIGGRVLAYNLGVDTFMVTNPTQYGKVYYNSTNNPYNGSWGYGGYKTWPAPQSVWNWPPPPKLAWGNYNYQLLSDTNDSLTLLLKGQTETTATPGLRFNRYITAYSNTTRIKVTTVMFNDSDHNQSWGIWDNTQTAVKHGNNTDYSNFSIYFPVARSGDVTSSSSLGNVPDREEVLPGIYRVKYTPTEGKIFARVTAGWTLYVDERDEQAYAKIFSLDPISDYPAGEKPVEVYTNGSVNYLELEIVGPLHTLTPGDSSIFTENWFAARTSGPVYNTTVAGIVKKKLAYDSQSGTLSGEYGIFSKGKISWAFLDNNYAVLDTGGGMNVSPLVKVNLNEQVTPSAQTRYIELQAFDSKGNFIGDLDTLDLSAPTLITQHQQHKFEVEINGPLMKGGDINFTFNTPSPGTVSIGLYSLNGALIKNAENVYLEQGISHKSISSQGLNTGLYLVRIVGQKEVQVFKVLIK